MGYTLACHLPVALHLSHCIGHSRSASGTSPESPVPVRLLQSVLRSQGSTLALNPLWRCHQSLPSIARQIELQLVMNRLNLNRVIWRDDPRQLELGCAPSMWEEIILGPTTADSAVNWSSLVDLTFSQIPRLNRRFSATGVATGCIESALMLPKLAQSCARDAYKALFGANTPSGQVKLTLNAQVRHAGILVFYWDGNGRTVYGVVRCIRCLRDGSVIVDIRTMSRATITLPELTYSQTFERSKSLVNDLFIEQTDTKEPKMREQGKVSGKESQKPTNKIETSLGVRDPERVQEKPERLSSTHVSPHNRGLDRSLEVSRLYLLIPLGSAKDRSLVTEFEPWEYQYHVEPITACSICRVAFAVALMLNC
ncbi:hypothetical protein C8R46DRAFT_1050524 [Mycena filopes]|nr:hypothetical protein C8R46DRAFT_1050524 [Mycena filopes]